MTTNNLTPDLIPLSMQLDAANARIKELEAMLPAEGVVVCGKFPHRSATVKHHPDIPCVEVTFSNTKNGAGWTTFWGDLVEFHMEEMENRAVAEERESAALGKVRELEEQRDRLIGDVPVHVEPAKPSQSEPTGMSGWRVWKAMSLVCVENESSQTCWIRDGAGAFDKSNDEGEDWYRYNGYTDITTTPEGQSILADLEKFIEGRKGDKS